MVGSIAHQRCLVIRRRAERENIRSVVFYASGEENREAEGKGWLCFFLPPRYVHCIFTAVCANHITINP